MKYSTKKNISIKIEINNKPNKDIAENKKKKKKKDDVNIWT
jgi:hypothetical protein